MALMTKVYKTPVDLVGWLGYNLLINQWIGSRYEVPCHRP